LGDPKKPLDVEIVGVARAAHYNSIQEEVPPTAYLPFTQDLPGLHQMFFEVRTSGDPLALMNPIRGIIHAASAAVSVTDVGTQKLRIEQTVGQERTFADLCTCFAALALAIACVGLYGAMAYAVARRTRELGIRMALGAKRPAIVWMVVREALALSAVGLLIGYLAARQTSQWIASFLFGLKPTDPVAIALSVSILLAASVAASLAPAWKASHTDPMLAIRHE
jgi:ABC-type lipoprotein release transport system permease subunit